MYKTLFRQTVLVPLMLTLIFTLGACGGGKEPTRSESPAVVGDAAAGKNVYLTTCIACHGPDAKGIEGLGKSLHPTDSDFVSSRSDDELVEYIKVGRRIDDPLNTTGIDMPPKGGNPAMTEADMYNVVAYMRTLD